MLHDVARAAQLRDNLACLARVDAVQKRQLERDTRAQCLDHQAALTLPLLRLGREARARLAHAVECQRGAPRTVAPALVDACDARCLLVVDEA